MRYRFRFSESPLGEFGAVSVIVTDEDFVFGPDRVLSATKAVRLLIDAKVFEIPYSNIVSVERLG